MAIALLSVQPRHERRVRLTFTNTLDTGAYGVPGPAYYTLTNENDTGEDPSIVAAMAVSGSPSIVELAISSDLAQGGLYKLVAVGVPATDASTTPGGSEQSFYFAATTKAGPPTEPRIRDRDRLLYGVDLLWNGTDFQEEANGDWARVEGSANVTKNMWRSVSTSALPWDRTWGFQAREYVDSPESLAVPLRGAATSQIMRDRRVRRVSSEIEIQDNKTYLHLTPTLVSGDTVDPVSVTIQND